MLKTIKLLLPALIPSWRFFDAVAPSPRIEFCMLETVSHGSDHWQEFRRRPAHLSIANMLKRLFWNPCWNETLFMISCAERIMDNPTKHSTQEIMKRICLTIDRNGLTGKLAPYLQFRLVLISRQGAELQKQITFVSPVYRYLGDIVE